jgi:hypothetical protein
MKHSFPTQQVRALLAAAARMAPASPDADRGAYAYAAVLCRLALRCTPRTKSDRKRSLNDGQIQNPSTRLLIVPLSKFVLSGFGFVHDSIAIPYHEVPNPNLTIRNFCIAVSPSPGPRCCCASQWKNSCPRSLPATIWFLHRNNLVVDFKSPYSTRPQGGGGSRGGGAGRARGRAVRVHALRGG